MSLPSDFFRSCLGAGGSRVSVEQALSSGAAAAVEPVLVSYSYFEKDDVQRANFEFFIAVRRFASPLQL